MSPTPEAPACNHFRVSRIGIVLDHQPDLVISRSLDELLAEAEFVIEPVTEHQARLARQACALALDTREPLLWEGDDFGHTGTASALTR